MVIVRKMLIFDRSEKQISKIRRREKRLRRRERPISIQQINRKIERDQ
jgi:hypothetical protein